MCIQTCKYLSLCIQTIPFSLYSSRRERLAECLWNMKQTSPKVKPAKSNLKKKKKQCALGIKNYCYRYFSSLIPSCAAKISCAARKVFLHTCIRLLVSFVCIEHRKWFTVGCSFNFFKTTTVLGAFKWARYKSGKLVFRICCERSCSPKNYIVVLHVV